MGLNPTPTNGDGSGALATLRGLGNRIEARPNGTLWEGLSYTLPGRVQIPEASS